MSDHLEHGIGEQVLAIARTCPFDDDAIPRLYLQWCKAVNGDEGFEIVSYDYSWPGGIRSIQYMTGPDDTSEYIALLKAAIHEVCKKMGDN